jgi:hypothetical protein
MDDTAGQSKRRTEITIETHSITIIRTSDQRFSSFCERCEKTVSAFTPEQLATLMRLELNEICRRVDSGELHLTETGRSFALVCGNSERKEIRFNPKEKGQS